MRLIDADALKENCDIRVGDTTIKLGKMCTGRDNDDFCSYGEREGE